MDKPNNGNTITIKLNGEQKAFKEEPREKGVIPHQQAEPPAIIEPEYPEPEGLMETAAAQEVMDEFDWIIPESSDMVIEEYEIPADRKFSKKGAAKFASTKSNHPATSWFSFKSIVFSVVFAVLLGTAFGFLMLKLVNSQYPTTPASPGTANSTTSENSSSSGKAVSGKSGAVMADIQPVTAYVVQGGVFSTSDAAKGPADNLKGQGVPSVMVEMNGKDYLFMGVAESIDSARQLAGFYKGKGINDVYAKSLELAEKKLSGLTDTEKSFLESSLTIYQDLSKVTASAICANTFPDGVLKNANEQLNRTAQKPLKNEKINAMKEDLSKAYSKIKTYQTSEANKDLSDAQQYLLSYLSHYYSL